MDNDDDADMDGQSGPVISPNSRFESEDVFFSPEPESSEHEPLLLSLEFFALGLRYLDKYISGMQEAGLASTIDRARAEVQDQVLGIIRSCPEGELGHHLPRLLQLFEAPPLEPPVVGRHRTPYTPDHNEPLTPPDNVARPGNKEDVDASAAVVMERLSLRTGITLPDACTESLTRKTRKRARPPSNTDVENNSPADETPESLTKKARVQSDQPASPAGSGTDAMDTVGATSTDIIPEDEHTLTPDDEPVLSCSPSMKESLGIYSDPGMLAKAIGKLENIARVIEIVIPTDKPERNLFQPYSGKDITGEIAHLAENLHLIDVRFTMGTLQKRVNICHLSRLIAAVLERSQRIRLSPKQKDIFLSNGVTKRQMSQDRSELKRMATLHAQHGGLIIMFPTKDNDLGIKSDTYFMYPTKINFELVFLYQLHKLDVRRWCAIGKAVLDHLMLERDDGTKDSGAKEGVTEERSTNELAICGQKINLSLPIDDIVKKLTTDESIRCNCPGSDN